jgi:circadian clock protein KaiC
MGIAVILINETSEIIGNLQATDIGVSYIADTIILVRYVELKGQLRRVIGVLKKRLSDFEKSLREFEITKYGLKVGHPLTELRGILTGIPEEQDKPNGPRS